MSEHVKLEIYNQVTNMQHYDIQLESEDSDFEVIPTGTAITFSDAWEVPNLEQKPQMVSWQHQIMVYVDEFENIDLLDEKLISRSMWISPIPKSFLGAEPRIARSLNSWSCGLVLDVRIR